jgi:HEAT repeat protein
MIDDASWPLNEKAVDAVLLLKPADITDKAVRKQIAVNFRTLATTEGHHIDAGKAIRGLVLYGGKYSVPILVEILKRERFKVPRELFDGLAQYPDARGAEAIVPQLANAFNREAAASTIRTMGPVAEDALVTIAPSDDPAVSLAAVKLLGEVGTEKCVPLLGKAARSSNADVADAAKASLTAIRQRTQKPAAAGK